MVLQEILVVAGRQHGCISRKQALQIASRNQLERLVANQTLVVISPSVYAILGVVNDWHTRAMGAVLSVPGAVLSHSSATKLHGISFGETAAIHVTTSSKANYERPGVVVHRSDQLAPFATKFRSFETTNIARSIVDCSQSMSYKQLAALVDQACNLKLIKLAELDHCLDQMVTKGRQKVSNLRQVLSVRNINDENLDTFLERRALRWIRKAGLPEPQVQKMVCANGTKYRPDIQYIDQRIAIEPDGPHHLLPTIAAYDRRRDFDLQIAGWLVIHSYIDDELGELIPRIRRALADRTRIAS